MESILRLLEVLTVASGNLNWRTVIPIYRLCDLGQVISSLEAAVLSLRKMRTIIVSIGCACLKIK